MTVGNAELWVPLLDGRPGSHLLVPGHYLWRRTEGVPLGVRVDDVTVRDGRVCVLAGDWSEWVQITELEWAFDHE